MGRRSSGGLGFILLVSLFFSSSVFAAKTHSSSKAGSEVLSDQALDLYTNQSFLSATRSLQRIQHVTDNVTVITREELDRWPVADLDEALGLINGIVVQDDGDVGQVTTAQLYGSKPREVRVMVDGITFNATTTGGIADLSQIPLDNVEKIEIIKGASSSVWGSAMGGVINIITRPSGSVLIPKGNISLTFGGFGTQREKGEISGALGPLSYYGMGSYVESGGFRPNSDILEKRSFLKGEIPLTDELQFKGSFGYSGSKVSEFDLPDIGQNFKRKIYSHYGNAGFTFSPGDRVHAEIFYKLSERSFRRVTSLLPAYTFFQLAKAQSMIHETSFTTVWDMDRNQTLVLGSDFGVEVYRDAIFRATTTRADVNKESTRQAYFGNYQLSWKSLDVTIGSRLDATNSYGVYFDPSAGFGLHLPFWRTIFRGNVSRAFNAPSFVDRYLSAGTTVANPDLKAETAIAYNLGPEIQPFSRLHAKTVFFQSFLQDSITTITRSDGLRQAVNINRERRTGFETELLLGPWKGLSFSYATTYVMAIDPKAGPVQSRPRFTQDVKTNYEKMFWGFRFNLHLAGRYTDLVTYSGFTDPIDGTFIFDGKLMLTFPKAVYGNLTAFLEGQNLLNGNFAFDGARDPWPRRNFEASVKFNF